MADVSWGSFGTNSSTESREPEKTETEREERSRRERPARERDEGDRDPRERAPRKRERTGGSSVGDFLSSLTAENWVDIVCCTLIAVFLIVVICNWAAFSAWLFQSVLFPIITIGTKIVSFVAGVGITIGAIVLWVRSRTRRRWW